MTGTLIAISGLAVGCVIFEKINSSWGKSEPSAMAQTVQAVGQGTALLLALQFLYKVYQQVSIMF